MHSRLPLWRHLQSNAFAFFVAIGISAEQKGYEDIGGHLIIVPDAHGDRETLEEAFRMVDVPLLRASASEHNFQVLFLGDAVDRGPNPSGCYEVLENVKAIRLLGNHEWLNLLGVDEKDDPSTPHIQEDLFKPYVSAEDLAFFGGWKQRKEAFGRTGILGKPIRETFQLVQLLPNPWGKHGELPPLQAAATLFLHAGITSSLALEYRSAADMNAEGRAALERSIHGDDSGLHSKLYYEVLQERFLVRGSEDRACQDLEKTLAHLGAARLVVGHTPQQKKALIRCGGRFVVLDVAMSRWMRGGPIGRLGNPAVLEMKYEGQSGSEMLTALQVVYSDGVEVVPPFSGKNDSSSISHGEL